MNLRNLVESGDLDEIKTYLKTADKNITGQYDNDNRNALYYAILGGNVEIVHCLIQFGFNPNDIDKNSGETALHLAASLGNFDLVLYLIDIAHVDADALDPDGRNALYYALMHLNKNKPDPEFIVSPEHLDVAWLLAGHGVPFQPDMYNIRPELEAFEHTLLQYIHQDIQDLNQDHIGRNLNFIKFISDAMDFYKLFFNDISKTLPDINLYDTLAFKKSTHKIPLAFGWQISAWDLTNKCMVPLSKNDMRPSVYDLVDIAPVLINVGDMDANLITLIDSFNFSLHQKFKSSDIRIINVVSDLQNTYSFDGYFDDVTTTTDTNIITNLCAEVDRRKNLSASGRATELPILCFIDDLSKIANKKLLGDIQNILFNGCEVGIFVIAAGRGKIPTLVRANFQSVITFHTTASDGKKIINCANTTELGIDEMLFISPMVHDTNPIHIKMEK